MDARQGAASSAFKPASLATNTPDAPSQIWLEVAAVMAPPSRISFTAAMASRLASKRMPSSTRAGLRPVVERHGEGHDLGLEGARIGRARRLHMAFISEAVEFVFVSRYFSAIISAPTNWLNWVSG